MTQKPNPAVVKMAFEEQQLSIRFDNIRPLKLIPAAIMKTPKYVQIATSIREIGLIEPPVVARDREEPRNYLLLDGHSRIAILKDMGKTEVICLISTDDEAYTYNKRVNRVASIQEHKMILKALDRGVSEARLANVLNVDVQSIRRKRQLLSGICPEVAEILKEKHVAFETFTLLKLMAPLRQIEAAELMVAMNKYTVSYAKSLLAATCQSQLSTSVRSKSAGGVTDEQVALVEHESVALDREFMIAEKSYGSDHLDLVLAHGYLNRLLNNRRIARSLEKDHPEILAEFRKLVEANVAAI